MNSRRPVRRKCHVARRVTAPRFTQGRHDDFRGATGPEIAGVIGEPHHRVVVRDVDPLRVFTRGVKCDAEGPVESVGENVSLGRAVCAIGSPEHAEAVRAGLGDEDIAVGRHPQQARILQSGGKLPDRGNPPAPTTARRWAALTARGPFPAEIGGVRRGRLTKPI